LCPGFVSDTGLYREARGRYGVTPHWRVGTCTSTQVARAALQAIERDEPETIVNRTPFRDIAAFGVAFPRIAERVARVLDIYEPARRLAELRRAERDAGSR
jgi:hypothetical protein